MKDTLITVQAMVGGNTLTLKPMKLHKTYIYMCQIKDQIDLKQLNLTGILTFLAAIYLPFSLISVRGSPNN